MKLTLYVVAAVVVCAVYYGVSIYRKMEIAKQLVAKGIPLTLANEDHSVSMLVLGDSTALGVGARSPEDSTAGRLAKHVSATYVENYAVSGAQVHDLEKQIAQAKLGSYMYVLIHIGGSDIIRFHDAEAAAQTLKQAMEKLPAAEKVIVATAGNVGGTTFFPWFLRPLYTRQTLAYHEAFAKVVAERSAIYVNLYEDPNTDPFVQEPETYLSADGLHPSSEGYFLWYGGIIEKAGL